MKYKHSVHIQFTYKKYNTNKCIYIYIYLYSSHVQNTIQTQCAYTIHIYKIQYKQVCVYIYIYIYIYLYSSHVQNSIQTQCAYKIHI